MWAVKVWAYANLGHRPTAGLLDAAASTAEWSMTNFTPQNLSNMLWSFAKLDTLHTGLFKSAIAHTPMILSHFQPQSVVMAPHSCSRLLPGPAGMDCS